MTAFGAAASDDIEALLKRAKQCLRDREVDQALEHFRAALALDERRCDIHEGLAMCHFGRKEYAEAAEHFLRITRLEPMNGKALVNLGAVYNRMKEFNKAVDALRKAVQKEKKCAEGYYNLGLAYKGLNQLSMAVSAYREALRIDSRMASAHQNLANAYVDMGNFQQAIAHFKQALEIDPGFDSARRGLEAAEQSSAAAKSAISPFGRLVGEGGSQKAAKAFSRRMTDDERQIDRQQLYEMCPYLEEAVNAYRTLLQHELERRILTLNRAVAQGNEGRVSLIEAAEHFRSAVTRAAECRRALKRKILELRAHEELVCTPLK